MVSLPGALADLFATAPVNAEAKAHVRSLMSSSERFYHGLAHVALLWQRHRRFASAAGFAGEHENRLVASAILFHDCVYTAGRSDNEARSADVWLEAAKISGVAPADRTWVAETIRATRDHLAKLDHLNKVCVHETRLRAWMLDLDLTPLGEAPKAFDQNARRLRAEAAHMSDAVCKAGMRSMLQRFADAPVIYRTPPLAAHFDAPARRNLARYLNEGSRDRDATS